MLRSFSRPASQPGDPNKDATMARWSWIIPLSTSKKINEVTCKILDKVRKGLPGTNALAYLASSSVTKKKV
jgi:hypothetical protein